MSNLTVKENYGIRQLATLFKHNLIGKSKFSKKDQQKKITTEADFMCDIVYIFFYNLDPNRVWGF